MMHRYFALVWSPENLESTRAVQSLEARLASAATGWITAYKEQGCVVLHTGARVGASEAYQLAERAGVVIGKLFHRHQEDHQARVPLEFSIRETRHIIETGGQHLVDHYWGRYVAVIVDHADRRHHILRDPMAELTCYHCTWAGIDVFFSHIEDCVQFVRRDFTFNWQYLIAYLVAGRILNGDTGLSEVDDVSGGERVTLTQSRTARKLLWNPTHFRQSLAFERPEEAARVLRSTVQSTVNAWASCYDKILHSLSGGLDSSIVAGCLAQAPSRPDITCLNFYVGFNPESEQVLFPTVSKENLAKLRRVMGHADERSFARVVAERWSFPLIETPRISDYDLTPIWRSPLDVIPTAFGSAIDTDDAEVKVVRNTKAQAFFSGMFGDTVFYATFQAFGAIDYAYQHGLDHRFLSELFSTCALSRESMWRVLMKSLRYGILRLPMPPVVDNLRRPNLLRDSIVGRVDASYLEHPWIRHSPSLPPGKQSQVRGLVASLPYHFRFHRQRYAVAINPLAAQPVVETCLQTPVYTLLAGGVTRGLARLAFADLLPTEVRNRTTKGAGGAFYQRLVQNNRVFIRESLMDGLLVNHGLLDASKVDSYLTEDQVFTSVTPEQIRKYLGAEAWLRQWTDLTTKKAAA